MFPRYLRGFDLLLFAGWSKKKKYSRPLIQWRKWVKSFSWQLYRPCKENIKKNYPVSSISVSEGKLSIKSLTLDAKYLNNSNNFLASTSAITIRKFFLSFYICWYIFVIKKKPFSSFNFGIFFFILALEFGALIYGRPPSPSTKRDFNQITCFFYFSVFGFEFVICIFI